MILLVINKNSSIAHIVSYISPTSELKWCIALCGAPLMFNKRERWMKSFTPPIPLLPLHCCPLHCRGSTIGRLLVPVGRWRCSHLPDRCGGMHVLLLLFQTFNQLPLDGQQTTLPDLYRGSSVSVQHVRAEYSHFPQKQTYVRLLLYPDSTLSCDRVETPS